MTESLSFQQIIRMIAHESIINNQHQGSFKSYIVLSFIYLSYVSPTQCNFLNVTIKWDEMYVPFSMKAAFHFDPVLYGL